MTGPSRARPGDRPWKANAAPKSKVRAGLKSEEEEEEEEEFIRIQRIL